MKTQFKVAALLAGLLLSAQASAVYVIDDFSAPQAKVEDGVIDGLAVSSQLATASVLGGYRDLIVEKKAYGGDTDDTAFASSLLVAGGVLSFSNDADVGGTGIVRWDGSNSASAINATGLGGVDLTGYGNAFVFNIKKADHPFQIVLEAYTSAGQYSKYTINGTAGSGSVYSIMFSDLLSAGATKVGGGVDLSSLGALQIVLDPSASSLDLDMSIDSVTVPEPASLALVGLGLLGLGAARRRQAK